VYLTTTRPDIQFAVNMLSRFMHCASELHLKAAKKVLRYIRGTQEFGIMFGRLEDITLYGFSDNDWAGSSDDMKSTSGYLFSLESGYFS